MCFRKQLGLFSEFMCNHEKGVSLQHGGHTSACQYVTELQRDIEKKIRTLQYDCSQLQMLFKPWPRKGPPDDKEMFNVMNTHSENPKSEEVHRESLTQDEKEAMDAMEKLLVKAQKARDLQKKTEECPKSYSRTSASSSQTLASSSQRKELKTDEEGKPKTAMSTDKINSSIKHDVKNKILKTSTSDKLTQNKKAEIRKLNGMSRPPPSNKYHVKAPFQTNPCLSFPKNSTNQEAMTKGTRSKKFVPRGATKAMKGTPAAGQIKQSQSAGQGHSAGHVSQGHSAGQVNQGHSAGQVSQGHSAGQIKVISQGHSAESQSMEKGEIETKNNEKFEMDDTSPDSREKTKSPPGHSSCIDSKSVRVEKCPAPSVSGATFKEHIGEPEADNRFHLLKNGNDIDIPVKLRRLVSLNHKLRQKLAVTKVTKKVDSTKSGQYFLDSLERLFDRDLGYDMAANLQRAEQEYDSLRRMLEELTTELTDECLHDLKFVKAPAEHQWSPSPPHSKSAMLWSPFIDKFTLPLLNSQVCYRSYKQLERYLHLVFQLQYKQLTKKIQSALVSTVTAQMESTDISPCDYSQLLRSLSFVTDSKTYPVIVRDTMEDTEQSSS
ncbi:uncharacterized protein LOC125672460 isoform X4 [Ostrea edulis]|uniref:uncharacterized protein LOC125672460 isoform X4 n=1 Tax=Ostrea edulis TaxID=37623 RepID=UPI0024AFE3CA|nr:uncharacterized protein LOC125672460 isoform X4 [Ostrea edulis]